MGITKQPFGTTPEGISVDLYTLTNTNGMTVTITTYGAIIVMLKTPDRTGKLSDVVLGFDTLQEYIDSNTYFGATIGRYGNRIAGGKFTLNGREYSLTVNDGINHLHGGTKGFDKVVWRAQQPSEASTPVLELTHVSPDGEQGYPGTICIKVRYTLTDENAVRIEYYASTDRDTVLNPTHHSYFNLSGKGNALKHELKINANRFTPTTDDLIPTGELRDVESTPMDFRKSTVIGNRITDDYDQLNIGAGGYDHNYVLNTNRDLSVLAASVYEPESGRQMDVYTTEPGMQFYIGSSLDGTITGKEGTVYRKYSGLCLETQHFPDSPNQNGFPSTILKKGENYTSTTVYKFAARK